MERDEEFCPNCGPTDIDETPYGYRCLYCSADYLPKRIVRETKIEEREIMGNNLRKKIYDISNSFLPLDMFYNDIENMSKYPSFNSENAFKDLEKIANFIDDCQQQLTITEKALELACRHINCIDVDGFKCSGEKNCIDCHNKFHSEKHLSIYFMQKAKEMLENE